MTVNRVFETATPITLYVEFAAGRLDVVASERVDTTVEVSSPDATLEERITIERQGSTIVVAVPRAAYGIFRRLSEAMITVHVPTDSSLQVKTATADVRATGRFGDTYARSGSGDIALGDVAGTLSAKAASGHLSVGQVHGTASLATGSGHISVSSCSADTSLRSGSGSMRVGSASADLSVATGSGKVRIEEFARGELRGRLGSGGLWIGIPDGVAVWTDLQCPGGIESTLPAMGPPAEGAPFVKVHLRMGSGKAHLDPVEAGVVADQLH